LNLCHLDDRRLVEKEVNEFLAGRRDRIELQHRLRHKNGSYRWVIVNAKPVKDGDGKEPRSIGLITDITDLKRLEAAKRESERRLRDFAQALPDISMIVDENGQYVEVFGQDEKLLRGRARNSGGVPCTRDCWRSMPTFWSVSYAKR
jgi:PAS domain-containing protein